VNPKRIWFAVALAASVTVLMAFVYFYLSHKGHWPETGYELCCWAWNTRAVIPLAVLGLGLGWIIGRSRPPADSAA
jgi:hypothetical protein